MISDVEYLFTYVGGQREQKAPTELRRHLETENEAGSSR